MDENLNQAEQKNERSKSRFTFELIAVLLLLVAISATLYRAWFSRYMADDYCLSARANASNLIDFVRANYQNWSGRFSCFISVWFFSKLRPAGFGAGLTSLFMLWVVALDTLIILLTEKFRISVSKRQALLIALVIILATIETSPSKFQSFLWRDGFIHHTFPIIWFTFALFVLFALSKHEAIPIYFRAVLIFLVVFLAGGFSEASSMSFVAFFAVAAGASLMYRKSTTLSGSDRILLLIALLASVFAFLVEYIAPGNMTRSGLLPARSQSLIATILLSLRNALFIAGKYVVYSPGYAILAVGAGFLLLPCGVVQPDSGRKIFTIFIGLAASLAVLLLTIVFPVAVLMQAYPEPRAISLPNYYITIVLICFGALLKRYLSLRHAGQRTVIRERLTTAVRIGLLILTVALTISVVSQFAKDYPALKDYAARWDDRQTRIIDARAAGITKVTVPGLESRDLVADIGDDPDDWVNACMAAYYGMEKITGR